MRNEDQVQRAAVKIGALVQEYHTQGKFDGVVLASRNDQTVFRGAVGQADRTRSIALAPDLPFPICSITKQFTALLVLQQVARGALRLDGKVSDYLPTFRRDTGNRITLKHLLTHTSGLPNTDDFSGFYESIDPRCAEADYVVRTYLQSDLAAAPGTKFRYNNADYLLLAILLEKTTGASYASLLHERIVKPLGMAHTGLLAARGGMSSPVLGYAHPGNDPLLSQPIYHLANYGAAGAMVATVDDLLRWDRALLTDRLLPRKWRDVMWQSDPKMGYVACGSWVYGYQPYGKKTPTLVERQGGIGALHTQNLLVPEDGLSLILLSNLEDADVAAYTGKGLACDILHTLYEVQ